MIDYKEFEKVEIRVGTIVEVNEFPEAKKPAWQLKIDFGEFGIKQSSAQLTGLYTKEDLLNRQVMAVTNFPPKQIANFFSECLVLGFPNDKNQVVLATVERE